MSLIVMFCCFFLAFFTIAKNVNMIIYRLRFHDMHGANVSLSSDKTTAKHLHGYGKSLIFSSRPIRIGERVCVKFVKLSNKQSNAICFGFTSKNPDSLDDLHSSSYLDLFKSHYWVWPLFKNMSVEGAIFFYYVSRNGEVHFGIDGLEIESFYKKVDITRPLWAVLDIDGEATTVQLAVPPEMPETDEPENDYFEQVEETGEEVEEDELCTVCYQKGINAVLYKCGHMCMCYECAVQQKHGAGNGQCPFCRAVIKDVIRTYR